MAAVGRWQTALECFHLMAMRQVRKDTVSYNTSMTLCTRSGELEKSLALYAEMTANELPKDRFTYSAAVKAGGRA